jgi:hypothetical protein
LEVQASASIVRNILPPSPQVPYSHPFSTYLDKDSNSKVHGVGEVILKGWWYGTLGVPF